MHYILLFSVDKTTTQSKSKKYKLSINCLLFTFSHLLLVKGKKIFQEQFQKLEKSFSNFHFHKISITYK